MNAEIIKKTTLLTIFFCTLNIAAIVNAAKLFADKSTLSDDKTFELTISVDKVEKLAGIKLSLSYDKSLFKYLKMERSKQTQSLMHVVNDKNPGKLIIVMAGATGKSGINLKLMKLTFDLLREVPADRKFVFEVKEIQLMSDELKDIPCPIEKIEGKFP